MYDIVEEINKEVKKRGLNATELGELTGIDRYVLYSVLTYHTYLTKIMYYALRVVLGVESKVPLEEALEANKEKVGLPETNIKVAKGMVDEETVEKMQKELLNLRAYKNREQEREQRIKELQIEVEELEKELAEHKQAEGEEYKKGYAAGVRTNAEVLRKAEIIVDKREKEIENLIIEIEELRRKNKEKRESTKKRKEVGERVPVEVIVQMYRLGNLSKEEISEQIGVRVEEVEEVIKAEGVGRVSEKKVRSKKERIIDAYKEGKTRKEIADMLSISKAYISKVLTEYKKE